MPIYEFACAACGARFDRRMAMQDPSPACPSCGAVEVRRLISLFASTTDRSRPAAFPGEARVGGGCCGGACACGGG